MNKQKWMDCALQMGMDSFEIYQGLSSQKEVTWFNGQMDTFVSSKVLGTSIRGILDGNMANMALEQVDDDACESVLSSLIDQMRTVTSKEKDVLRMPETIESLEREECWISPSMDLVYDVMKSIEQKVMAYDPRMIQVAHLAWHESKSSREITNTNGIQAFDEDCVQYLVLSVVARENDDIKDEMAIEIVHDLSVFDIEQFVKDLCDKTILKLNSTSLSSRTCPVIFEKDAMTSLFSAFTGLFSGDLIFKGISCLKGKEDTKIFSDLITIEDNPRNLDALSICTFDDEGCPTKEKVLVDQGIFKLALQSTKSALRMKTESTGNGFKSGYASSVSVQPMNCCIKPGQKSLDELCQEMKEGLVITDLAGLHSGIDFVSTNFSLQASGYYVKDGKRAQSITLITVADSFMNLMNKVVEVGNDLDWKYHSVVCPSIYFKECAISGE